MTLNQTNVNSGVFVIYIDDSSDSPSTLTLNHVAVENGQWGIVESANVGTVNLIDSTVKNNIGLGVTVGAVTVTDSTITDNGNTGIDVANDAVVTNSAISNNFTSSESAAPCRLRRASLDWSMASCFL